MTELDLPHPIYFDQEGAIPYYPKGAIQYYPKRKQEGKYYTKNELLNLSVNLNVNVSLSFLMACM